MEKPPARFILSIVIIPVILLFIVMTVSAEVQTSENYRIESDVISGGGGEGSTDNYFVEHTTGQPGTTGESSSEHYVSYAGFWYTVPPVAVDDLDGDGVPDSIDNCTNVPNADQKDSNADEDDNTSLEGVQHYGNACDTDYSNNGFVGLEDFNGLRTCFGKPAPGGCEDIDCNGNGFIGLEDFNCLRTWFGKAPGPGSGG